MKFQIGKGGVSEGVLESLTSAFKTHKSVRISLLKSFERDRAKIKSIAEELSEKLPGHYKHTIIGFTIILRKVPKKVVKPKR